MDWPLDSGPDPDDPVFLFFGLTCSQPLIARFTLSFGIGHLGGYGLLALLLYHAINRSLLGWNRQAEMYSFWLLFRPGLQLI